MGRSWLTRGVLLVVLGSACASDAPNPPMPGVHEPGSGSAGQSWNGKESDAGTRADASAPSETPSVPSDAGESGTDASLDGASSQVDAAMPPPTVPTGFEAYLTLEVGTLPVVLSAPHGGTAPLPGVPERTMGTTVRDADTYELAALVQAELLSRTQQKAHLVSAKLSRKYIDFNRAATDAYEHAEAAPIYEAYHAALATAAKAARERDAACAILLDLHGQGQNNAVVFRGTRNGQTADRLELSKPGAFLQALLARKIMVEPTTATGSENVFFTGGHIVFAHGRKSEIAPLDAVQLEWGRNYRQTATASTAEHIALALISHLEARCPSVLH